MTDSNRDRCRDDDSDESGASEPRREETETSEPDDEPGNEKRGEKREAIDGTFSVASTDGRLGIPIEALEKIELQRNLEPGESVVDAVLAVVSTLQGCDPLELPPLYEAIDPVTLESTWSANRNRNTNARSPRVVWCAFVFDRTFVTVTSTGELYAGLLDGETDDE